METYELRAFLLNPLVQALCDTKATRLGDLLDDGFVHVDGPIVYASDIPSTTAFAEAVRMRRWDQAGVLLARGANPARLVVEDPATILRQGAAHKGLRKANVAALRRRRIAVLDANPSLPRFMTAMELAMAHPLCPLALRRALCAMRLDAERVQALGMVKWTSIEFDRASYAFSTKQTQLCTEGRVLRSQRRRLAKETVASYPWFQRLLLQSQVPVATEDRLLGFVLNMDGTGMPRDVFDHVLSFLAPRWQGSYARKVRSATMMMFRRCNGQHM
jgi:hypothetical protein